MIFWYSQPGSTDTWEALRARSPWMIAAIIALAAGKIPNPTPEIAQAAEVALDEAHRFAKESLFGGTTKAESAIGMFLSVAFGEFAFTPLGHAVRMGAEIGLDRALERIRDGQGDRTGPAELTLMGLGRALLVISELDWSVANKSGRGYEWPAEVFGEDKLVAFLE